MSSDQAISTTLQRLRATIKQVYTTAKNHSKCGTARRTLSYMQTRIGILDKLFDEICEDNKIIKSSPDAEAIEFVDSNEYSLVEEAYATLKAEIMDGIAQFQQAPDATPIVGQPVQIANDFRLPTINIPNINGDYNEWPSFKNSFEHLVANNQHLSDLQRLHYLKNNLTGEAKKLVQHYDIIEANYNAAWEKLKLRYDNKKLLATCYLKSLLHQSSQTKESASHIRLLIDNFTDSLDQIL